MKMTIPQTTPRALSAAEMQTVGGGAVYMKLEGVKGDCTETSSAAADSEWKYVNVRR